MLRVIHKHYIFPELNLSNNRMSTLPEEISECTQLERVDISQNSFIALPNCLFALPSLVTLDARKNFIAGKFASEGIKAKNFSGKTLNFLKTG